MPVTSAPPNEIGLTKIGHYDDMLSRSTLDEQLKKSGVPTTEVEIPHIVGMAGNARLLFYTSPKTGMHVTVLCIPHRYGIDAWAEDYYYFEGMSREDALADENVWIDNYDKCKDLDK